MSQVTEDFLAWASDSGRTLEQRYGLLRLTESVYQRHYKGEDKKNRDWEEERLRRENRLYDATFQPEINDQWLRFTVETAPGLKALDLDELGNDRPIRNLDFLRFMPGLEKVKLRNLEMDDIDPVGQLQELREFEICADLVESYAALSRCSNLEKIHVRTSHPWPVLSGWENLPKLETLHWMANGRSLESVPVLPRLRLLEVDRCGYLSDLAGCLRDFHQLPEMPQLEIFWGGAFYRLDGMGRYPKLRLVRVTGFFRDLSPCRDLPLCSHLRLMSDRIRGVESLAAMPRLHQLCIHSKRPQDYTRLMDSETLRELYVFGCDIPQPDIDVVRIMMPSSDELYALPEARPLEPLKVRVHPKHDPKNPWVDPCQFPESGPAGWDGRVEMRQSEVFWMEDQVAAALRAAGLLELPGVRLGHFGSQDRGSHPLFFNRPHCNHRSAGIRLLGSEAIGRIREVVDCLRPLVARTRHPWKIHVSANIAPEADEWDSEWRDSAEQLFIELVEGEKEAKRIRKREQEFLADEMRLELMRDLGDDPDLDDFEPTSLPLHDDDDYGSDGIAALRKAAYGDEDDEDGGGLKEGEPGEEDTSESWLPAFTELNPNLDWSVLEYLMFDIAENGVQVMRGLGVKVLSELLDAEVIYPEGESGEEG